MRKDYSDDAAGCMILLVTFLAGFAVAMCAVSVWLSVQPALADPLPPPALTAPHVSPGE